MSGLTDTENLRIRCAECGTQMVRVTHNDLRIPAETVCPNCGSHRVKRNENDEIERNFSGQPEIKTITHGHSKAIWGGYVFEFTWSALFGEQIYIYDAKTNERVRVPSRLEVEDDRYLWVLKESFKNARGQILWADPTVLPMELVFESSFNGKLTGHEHVFRSIATNEVKPMNDLKCPKCGSSHILWSDVRDTYQCQNCEFFVLKGQ
jgi:predicted RNA-binding Zn-ribbon protein involved in translation (DUF1610 family)